MSSHLSAYFDLSKPKIIGMVLVTTAIGFFLGKQEVGLSPVLLVTLLGTAVTCAGGASLNNYLERDVDCKMKRTSMRPIPAGVIRPADALGYGIFMVLAGVLLLVWKVNLLTGFLALLTAFLYVLVYTPLKRMTWLNTFVGAVPGAIPPMGGWVAATGELQAGAWILFFILFIWQHPHFYAIAWMYREDYKRGGFKMLSVIDPDGTRTFRQILVYSVLLIPVSLLPTVVGLSGPFYFTGALIIGLVMLSVGYLVSRSKSILGAKRLLQTSIIYLPVLFLLILVDVGVF